MGEEVAATAAAAADGGSKPHAVVVTYPLQGHVNPAVHLALRLAARGSPSRSSARSVHEQTARALGVADPSGYDVFAARAAAAKGAAAARRWRLPWTCGTRW